MLDRVTPVTYEIRFPSRTVILNGDLTLPEDAKGIVIFAHGSGSNRFSPRNRPVARQLNERGFATLLADLLTEEEDLDPDARFDIDLLTKRLCFGTEWVRNNPTTQDLPIAYFGASTGAAAALISAAKLGGISAIVSRGGRPDLAGPALRDVTCPTLLIVGGEDRQVIELNKQAYEYLAGMKELKLVPGATHLFEEPGALDEVAQLTADWLSRYLQTGTPVGRVA